MRYAARSGWISLLVALLACQSAGSAPPPAAPAATSARSSAPAAPAATAAPAAAAQPTQAGMPAPLAPPVTVRIGVLSSVSDSGIYIGLERGYYRDLGLELQRRDDSRPEHDQHADRHQPARRRRLRASTPIPSRPRPAGSASRWWPTRAVAPGLRLRGADRPPGPDGQRPDCSRRPTCAAARSTKLSPCDSPIRGSSACSSAAGSRATTSSSRYMPLPRHERGAGQQGAWTWAGSSSR